MFAILVAEMFLTSFPGFMIFVPPVTRFPAVIAIPLGRFMRTPLCVLHLSVIAVVIPVSGLCIGCA